MPFALKRPKAKLAACIMFFAAVMVGCDRRSAIGSFASAARASERDVSKTGGTDVAPAGQVDDAPLKDSGREPPGEALGCLPTDASARRVVVQLQVVADPSAGSRCRSKQLVLTIPEVSYRHALCTSGCAPFEFDSRKVDGGATYSCRTDLQNEVGELRVAGEVVQLEAHEGPIPDGQGPYAALNPSFDAGVLRRLQIPLPCGTRVEFDASGRAASIPK